MHISIAQEGNLDNIKSLWIEEVSDKLQNKFENLSFGDSLKSLVIGIVCIKPEFEFFFQENQPKYYTKKKVITRSGNSVEIENLLEYSVKLDYELFSSFEEMEFKKSLAKEILISLDTFHSIKALKDFDFKSFQDAFSSVLGYLH